ncbi:MAG: hypothetical protein HXX11_06925 [Desulfuromonadales bacterium]|nr:hypothetical protein [Desulfuromonadales bacterium]
MSSLMRRAYGHGGTRLEHIIVCAPPMESPPTPLWLKLPVLALLLAIPVLVSLYAVPTSTIPMRTVIDISKLEVKPPPPLVKPEPLKPEPIRPMERVVEPPRKEEPPPPQVVQKTLERRTIIPDTSELQRPTISRSMPSTLPAEGVYQPRVTRERRQIEIGGAATSTSTRLRREATLGEAPSEKTTISRSRGATAMDSSIARERVAVLRRTSPPGETTSGSIGIGTAQRPTTVRSGRASSSLEEAAPRVTATRERTKLAAGNGGGGDGESSSVGLVRGVSLMSLEICSSSQLQEEKIKDVLSVVGSRQSCRDEKGEFQFKGTKRVSSFNLMIYPSSGRKPSNRCKELEYAYTCLTTH